MSISEMGTSFVAVFDSVGADIVVVENKKEAKLAKFMHLYTCGDKIQTQQTSHEFQLDPFTTPQDLRMRSLRGEYCYLL